VKRRARQCADEEGRSSMIVDGAPGTGCPVIASLSGVDLALLVTEPSLSGLHDLRRILDVTRHFGIPARIVINKHDLSPEISAQIEAFADAEGVELEGVIPYDAAVPTALLDGHSVVENASSAAGNAMREIVYRVLSRLDDRDSESGGSG